MLLVAGDSFATFTEDKQTFGQIIAEQYNIPAITSAIPGGSNPAAVMRALKFIEKNPITHCIYHYTQQNRVPKNSSVESLERSLERLIEPNFSLSQTINTLRNVDLKCASMDYDSESLAQYLKITPPQIYTTMSFAYLTMLENVCRNKNIKLMIFSMFVPTNHLFEGSNTLTYATHYSPLYDWVYYREKAISENSSKATPEEVDAARGIYSNHLSPDENTFLVEHMKTSLPNWFIFEHNFNNNKHLKLESSTGNNAK